MAYHSNGYSPDDRDLHRDVDNRSNDGSEKPTYLMEHLATFTVSKETRIVYPADGMRRLLQLEKTNGIWSQKMQLCLDRSWVLVIDYETGNIMERFPANSIQEPTAFTSHDEKELYNNILVFIVTNSNPTYPPEMHIFQCQSISAQDLVEDLEQLRMGKTLTRSRKSSIPPPAYKPPTQHILNASRDAYRESDSELTANNDDTSSTTSEKYERDVTILNHCFDDIEKFIARIHHANAAAKELERRRKNRKSKKRDMGDGMLSMRTRPPPEKEFFDIFQKFKLSFILLAKLKAHIHDPNAPELVHFLFTPLAVIVEAAHDHYFGLHLPHKVISPLLTREAINLLMNCVTSKETELWHSLGEAWLVPRDQWKGHVPPYHPEFMDGWSPDYPVIDDNREPNYNTHYNDYDSNQENLSYYDPQRDNQKVDPSSNLDKDPSARSDISADSIERNGGDERGFVRSQDSWLDSLLARGANVVQVTYPRTANNDKELTVVRSEFLEVLDDSRKWWKARNSRGQIAHVPHTIVIAYHSGGNNDRNDDIFNNPLYTHYNRNPHRQDSPSDRYSGGRSPSGIEHAPTGPPISAAPVEWVRKERLDGPVANQPPPPPPPPMPPMGGVASSDPPKSDLKRTPEKPMESAMSVNMQDELQAALAMFLEKPRNLDIRQTPEVYIDKSSKPSEVNNWLKAKEFSENTCQKLQGSSGNDLFDLSSSQLVQLCGASEGKRLFGQLTIQKSVSGYQTVRSSELQARLAKARQKAEAT